MQYVIIHHMYFLKPKLCAKLYRYGGSAGSYKLLLDSCRHYWNTCLPLVTISVERDLLRKPLLELISIVATFVDRRKESIMEPSENLDQDCNVILAMYGLVFQAFADKVACYERI